MCISCLAENHFECMAPVDSDEGLGCCCNFNGPPEPMIIRGGVVKAAEDMKDPISTGRKRAAQAKPIEKGMVCEWAKLRYAGGGVIPIIGCMGNPASDIHHGPDKDILNNELTNLHRLCDSCHNRWHSLNDPYYGERPTPGTPFIPLDHVCLSHNDVALAEPRLVFDSEMWWAEPIHKRKAYWNERSARLDGGDTNAGGNETAPVGERSDLVGLE